MQQPQQPQQPQQLQHWEARQQARALPIRATLLLLLLTLCNMNC